MADTKITDLQLVDEMSDDLNLPADDTLQTYRVTGAQMKAWIAAALASQLVPVAGVMPFAGASAPTGYLLCDGAAVSRTTYAALFAILGVTHGQGNGTTTFNVPNYQGRFLRGVDNSAGFDPDKTGRTAMATGGNTGNNVGSVQGHGFQTHTHTQASHSHSVGGLANNGLTIGSSTFLMTNPGANSAQGTDSQTPTINSAAASGTNSQTTANETRPVNAYVNYIIKT